MSQRLPHLTSRLQGFGTTIFAEMTALALEHDAVNLGQGFPDFQAPQAVKDAAVRAIAEDHNQYAPGSGLPPLRQAVAEHQQRFWGLSYDPDTEVTVTAGATEAVCATLLALCEAGDEVVMFEPYYDSYRAGIAMAGGVERVVTLHPPDFTYDTADLEAAITPKTRAILLNSPHNPTGKVFDREELEHIARLCRDHDLLAITDEVYEHLVFDAVHTPLASLPGMRGRTVTISSAGKTFSVTGWKIGWLCAPPDLTTAVRTAKQFMTFTNGTPFQHAIVQALRLGDGYFEDFAAGYRGRRDRLVNGLSEIGFEVFRPQGTYFVTADVRSVGFEDGIEFCRTMPGKLGVAAVPNAAFYIDPRRGRSLVRFAFCKTDELLDEGISRLSALRGGA
ncbi:MAG: pyridoxal phosphate-dependent aminotransferase [Nitriliruptorales bacterium]|nr:pyridoxal phosphate-dependent aminotransferase [Nitriliruptorales bacterium]